MITRLSPIARVTGLVILLFSASLLPPLGLSLLLDDGAHRGFLLALAAGLVAGLGLWLGNWHARRELKARDGFLLVVLLWVSLAAIAALPLMFNIPDLSFTDAYFESMSGVTTTGATVLTGLDKLAPSINIWRAELHWFGGMGIIVLAVAVLPILGIGGMQMYKAETPGPMKDTKLTPRITETAKGLWVVYAGLTALGIVALKLAGMNWLDAVFHAFSAISTGGFSSHDTSVGYFNSPLIEGVLIVMMLLGGINFATHFLVWQRRTMAPYRTDPEVGTYLVVLALSSVMLAVYIWSHNVYADGLTALRYAAFNTISVATTTGFATVDYSLWPVFAPLWMLFLGIFSTCSGSTGGGIKMVRAQLLFKQAFREMGRLVHPQALMPVKLGGQIVANQIVFAVLAFLSLYGMSLLALSFLLVMSGLDYVTAFSAVIACMNTIGPALNEIGPAGSYAPLTDFQTWVCTLAMLLGRLEVFTLLVLFTPAFWRR